MIDVSLDGLRSASLDELEVLYAESSVGPAPAGRWRGATLRYLSPPRWARAVDWLLFDAPPFGIDFDRRCWWFVRPGLAAGRFDASLGPSRWRRTETLRLEYGASRLPGPIRRLLYDEVKPLGSELCLGLGGLNADAGRGEHFFFALVPYRNA
jgi:hypothetical protein